jgi:hypothetical protein
MKTACQEERRIFRQARPELGPLVAESRDQPPVPPHDDDVDDADDAKGVGQIEAPTALMRSSFTITRLRASAPANALAKSEQNANMWGCAGAARKGSLTIESAVRPSQAVRRKPGPIRGFGDRRGLKPTI